MFIFDIFKREARRLRVVSVVVALGMALLLGRLWYVQIVSAQQLEHSLLQQSYRQVREPGVRGRILDAQGRVMAENRPQYNVVLSSEDLRDQFSSEYNLLSKEYLRENPGATRLPTGALSEEADYIVVSNVSFQLSATLRQTNIIDAVRFKRFYQSNRHVPFQILTNLDTKQVAVFSEELSDRPYLDLEPQPVRNYPYRTAAAHILGYVQRTGEENKFLPPDYEGRKGLEAAFDDILSGLPGTNAVLVDHLGYRQPKGEVVTPAQAGKDLYLTINLPLQLAVEDIFRQSGNERGAAVVMDVHSGDILAMVSVPSFDPNEFVAGISKERWQELNDPKQDYLKNSATSEIYPPGSTFKIITTIACLETGVMNPDDTFHNTGIFTEDNYHIGDTAPAGDYNFESAFYHSCNSYFCHYGMKAGLRKILEVAHRFHLGEKVDFPTHEEEGIVPTPDEVGKSVPLNSTPFISIGQEVQVTPLQMAVMISAIANGGTIYWPRLVTHAVAPDGTEEELFAKARVRDQVQLDPHHLELVRHAMLEDTEHEGANGHLGFYAGNKPYLPGFHVAGKTGTAQVKSEGLDFKKVVWFDSYGPYENPRYAVVVVVLNGKSGGDTCAPLAKDIYAAIERMEQAPGKNPLVLN